MRISDWSSDVCSSDLERRAAAVPRLHDLAEGFVALQQTVQRLQRIQTVQRQRAAPMRLHEAPEPFPQASGPVRDLVEFAGQRLGAEDRKSTRLNCSH